MRATTIILLVLVLLAAAVAGSIVVAGCGIGVRDECDPASYEVRCGPRSNTRRICTKIDRRDYLLGIARQHFEEAIVTCPGATPQCIDSSGRAFCRDK